jgi:hypothetical protein
MPAAACRCFRKWLASPGARDTCPNCATPYDAALLRTYGFRPRPRRGAIVLDPAAIMNALGLPPNWGRDGALHAGCVASAGCFDDEMHGIAKRVF